MHRIKDLLDEFLLVRVEGVVDAMLLVHVPPVAHKLPAIMIEREPDLLPLLVAHALVELHRQGILLGIGGEEVSGEGGKGGQGSGGSQTANDVTAVNVVHGYRTVAQAAARETPESNPNGAFLRCR